MATTKTTGIEFTPGTYVVEYEDGVIQGPFDFKSAESMAAYAVSPCREDVRVSIFRFVDPEKTICVTFETVALLSRVGI